jgi:PAS domain-containing protein
VGVSRIIDDRKKYEIELQRSEEKYRIITENSNDLI